MTASYQAELEGAFQGLQMITQAHIGAWGFGSEQNWAVDQSAGEIVLTYEDGLVARAPVQVIGSYDSADDSWVWGWANSSIRPELTAAASAVRQYGQENQIQELLDGRISCDEFHAWELTALAVKLAGLNGAYRGPVGESLYVFMAFGEVSLSKL